MIGNWGLDGAGASVQLGNPDPSIYIMSALGLVNQSASDLKSAAGLCSDVAHSTLDGAEPSFYTAVKRHFYT